MSHAVVEAAASVVKQSAVALVLVASGVGVMGGGSAQGATPPSAPASAAASAPARAPASTLAAGRALHFQTVGANRIPRGVVASVAQDASGQVWVGTGDGPVRFDGYRFRPQEREHSAPAQRNLGWVRALLPARDGRVWLGTESQGLAFWEPAQDRVRDLPDRRLDGGPLPNIQALAEGPDGTIWVATLGGGLEQVNPTGLGVVAHRAGAGPGALPDDRVLALHVDRQGTLWVGTWAGLSRRRAGGTGFEPVFSTGSGSLQGRAVSRVMQAQDGRLWVGTQQGDLAWVDPASGQGRLLPRSDAAPSAVTALAEAPAGVIWVGRGVGIDLHDAVSGERLRALRHDPADVGGLGGIEVTSLWVDREGWVWVGTLGGGLQRHNPHPQALWVRGADADPDSPLHRPSARSLLAAADGRIWVGTQDHGIALLDAALQPLVRLPLPGAAASQPQPRVQGLAQAADGTVWVAIAGELLQYESRSGPPAAVPLLLRRVPHAAGDVSRLVATPDGLLWLCAFDGLYRLAPGAPAPQAVPRADGRPLVGEVLTAAPGPDGALWVGSALGLFRLPPGAAALEPVAAAPEAGLGHPVVTGLLWDRHGQLWLDTAVAGLHRMTAWDGQTARFDGVSERLGVIGRPFGANLMQDAQGRIWTQQHVYDPATDRLMELTLADGRHLGTGWFHSHAQTVDGWLLFGGSRGVLVVEPEAWTEVTDRPPLVLSELRVDGRRLPGGDWQRGLTLAPGQRSFSVELAALEYSEPARVRYAWRLQGLEEAWTTSDADQRAAAWAYLRPGHYTLQARASNRHGAWSDELLTLPVQVLPAWWQHPVLHALLALLAAALLAGALQWRTGALQRRKQVLEQVVRQRTLELQEMTHALQRESAALREASLTDPLTGLRNRRYLLQHIDADVAIAVRRWDEHQRRGAAHGAAPPADADLLFFLIDLDRFKQINDRHGHAAGDALLRQMRSRLSRVFRDTDHLVRWGGEEFLVVARGSSRAHAADLAERARRAVADEPFPLDDGRPLPCSCSIGFAALPLSVADPRALDWEDTVQLADALLFRVKSGRRDGWCGVVDAPGLDAPALARIKAGGWTAALQQGRLRAVQGPGPPT